MLVFFWGWGQIILEDEGSDGVRIIGDSTHQFGLDGTYQEFLEVAGVISPLNCVTHTLLIHPIFLVTPAGKYLGWLAVNNFM